MGNVNNTWGGARPNSGRKAQAGENRKHCGFYLKEKEIEIVKEYARSIKGEAWGTGGVVGNNKKVDELPPEERKRNISIFLNTEEKEKVAKFIEKLRSDKSTENKLALGVNHPKYPEARDEYNTIMKELGLESFMTTAKGNEEWTIRDMVSECSFQLFMYEKRGTRQYYERHHSPVERKVKARKNANLLWDFIEKYGEDAKKEFTSEAHGSKWDTTRIFTLI